jgi:FSR family fosmidomycin resistance protein-like MFS transporter
VLADFYVGAVGATLPYFVTKANYSYADIAGLALAQTTTASIAQPGFGLLADSTGCGGPCPPASPLLACA